MSEAEKLADVIVEQVAELPDRSSPEDWPEAMLITGDELRRIALTTRLAEAQERIDRYQQTWAENAPAVMYKARAESAEQLLSEMAEVARSARKELLFAGFTVDGASGIVRRVNNILAKYDSRKAR